MRTEVPAVAVGMVPLGIAVDEATDTIYVTNASDGTVSVINGATCNAGDTSGCGQKPATVRVGAFGNLNDQTLSAINAAGCNAARRPGCNARPPAVTVGREPSWTAVNLALHTVYVVLQGANDVAVLGNK